MEKNESADLCIYPEIHYGNIMQAVIAGTPSGLKKLARILNEIAEIDQDKEAMPKGERYHVPLKPGLELGQHSCTVEICRADAKGTGELPEYMK